MVTPCILLTATIVGRVVLAQGVLPKTDTRIQILKSLESTWRCQRPGFRMTRNRESNFHVDENLSREKSSLRRRKNTLRGPSSQIQSQRKIGSTRRTRFVQQLLHFLTFTCLKSWWESWQLSCYSDLRLCRVRRRVPSPVVWMPRVYSGSEGVAFSVARMRTRHRE